MVSSEKCLRLLSIDFLDTHTTLFHLRKYSTLELLNTYSRPIKLRRRMVFECTGIFNDVESLTKGLTILFHFKKI